MTDTHVVLPVSESTFKEIADQLRAAGYDHVFQEQLDDSIRIDMRGIVLALDPSELYARMNKAKSEPTAEQIAAGCDCQAPNGEFVRLISNHCPVHNDNPLPREEA